ncbi:hypothetical protein LWI29_014005 [Acer saccharum]|uniref:Uncharacterized protein n=1 Tax=Acer saccharum TaxID=4024 RepID=A0AA39VJ22_ACESA|nr:hypothetical protein LWI29_014005 [Acer saccharum]
MRRRVWVAESALTKASLVLPVCPLVGDGGADLAKGWLISIPEISLATGNSSETVRFGRIENLGIGKELGGGELEYAGPAHRSEYDSVSNSFGNLPLKGLSFLGVLKFIAIGLLLTVVFDFVIVLSTDRELELTVGDGVIGEDGGKEIKEEDRLVSGVEKDLIGVGSIPDPDWKVLQFMSLKFLDGDDPHRAGPFALTLL